MAAGPIAEPTPPSDRVRVGCAWLMTLLVSDLPDILWSWAGNGVPPWLVWAKPVALALTLAIVALLPRLRPLGPYGAVMLVLQLALLGSARLARWDIWRGAFAHADTSFTLGYAEAFARDLAVAGVVAIAVLLLRGGRAACFLVRGHPDATVSPIRWLGIGTGGSWRHFSWIFGIAAAVAVMIPTLMALHPSLADLRHAAPLLGPCVLFAAVNAFDEELYFRAAPLATLEGVVGRTQALLMTVVFFGLAHVLYGSPPGILGFAMTGFLAFVMGRSMLETRGIGAPWLIHLLPDIVIFASYAIAWVRR